MGQSQKNFPATTAKPRYKQLALLLLWQLLMITLGASLILLWQNPFLLFLILLILGFLTICAWFFLRPTSESADSRIYEFLFTQNNDAVFLLDMDGSHINANQRAAEMLGYTLEELKNLTLRDIIAPQESNESASVLPRLLAGESLPIYERNFRGKHGEIIPAEVNVKLIRDDYGRPLHVQSIARDIRQRKQSEIALQKSTQQLRTLVRALPDRAVVMDKQGYYRDILNTINANPATSGLDLIGKHISEISTAEFTKFCLDTIQRTLEADTAQVFEYDYQHPEKLQTFEGRTIPYVDVQTGEQLVIWVTRDITERKRAAEVLMESEKRLRAFASALPDRAIILDAQGYYRDVLKEDFENLPVNLKNPQGKHLRDFLPAEFVEFCLGKIVETLQAGKTLAFDYDIMIAGKQTYLDARTIPITHPQTGEPCVIWIARDISRIRQTEKELEYHNRLYSLITALALEFLNLPVEKLDAGITKALQQIGEFIEADRSYINLFTPDFKQRTIAYEWYARPIPPNPITRQVIDISGHQWSFNQYNQGLVVHVPSVQNLPDEAEVERSGLLSLGVKSVLSIPLFNDGKLIGTLGFHAMQAERDWPESLSDLLKIVGEIYMNALQRKLTDEALLDSEKRLRILISSMPDRTVILDREGRYHEILKEEYDTGAELEILQDVQPGQRIAELYSAEFNTFCLQKINDALNTQEVQLFQYSSPAGGNHQLEGRVIPFRDPKTREERVFWATRDISERIQAEQHRLALTLEKEKVEFLRQFVDSITHDLKTPITVIGTSLHLIERSQDSAKRQERMLVVRRQLATLTHMIDELLAVARLDEIPQLQFSPVDFYKILQEVVEFLTPKAELKQIKLSLNLEENSPRLLAAHEELSRALSNLIDNAIKYTPNNGAVTVNAHANGSQLLFEVQDTGIGMSPEEMKHVFERFFRTDRARSEAPGTGLGLEITRRIIELHGGKIDLESEVNRGTTFRVWLPLSIDEGLLHYQPKSP